MATFNKNRCTFLVIYGPGYGLVYATVEGLLAHCREHSNVLSYGEETAEDYLAQLASWAENATPGAAYAFWDCQWIVATDPKKDETDATWEDFSDEASDYLLGGRAGGSRKPASES